MLADEPTAELDEANEQLVLDALQRLRDQHGTTVVVVTHSPSVAASADRVVEIRDGQGRVSALATCTDVEVAYGDVRALAGVDLEVRDAARASR